jgi:hypothetical protein
MARHANEDAQEDIQEDTQEEPQEDVPEISTMEDIDMTDVE